MKAVIRLDVPEWQIGQEVMMIFKDTMEKHGKCEADDIVRCKDCKHYHKGFNCDLLQKPILKDDNWFCADGERRMDDA